MSGLSLAKEEPQMLSGEHGILLPPKIYLDTNHLINITKETERPAVYQERVDGHKAAYHHDIDALAGRHKKDFASAENLGWMKRFVRADRVVAALNPGFPVDELLARVDVTRCPAVNLFLEAHLQRVRAGHAVQDNDVETPLEAEEYSPT